VRPRRRPSRPARLLAHGLGLARGHYSRLVEVIVLSQVRDRVPLI
jgi:hypothetical protein